MKAAAAATLACFAAIACAATPSVAEPPVRAEAKPDARNRGSGTPRCPAGRRVYLKANEEDFDLRYDPTTPAYDELARVDWSIDLNGDRAVDYGLTFMGTSGSKGEAIRGVYVNCGGGEFVAVWGPDYVFAIDVPSDAHDRAGTWRRLDKVMLDRKRTLRFSRGRYREAL